MSNNPRKHHFVPECYLRLFTDTSRRFWKKEKYNEKISLVSPAQVCYEIDSNKIRTKVTLLFNNLSDEYFIEKESFKKQENNYGKTVREVIKYSGTPSLIEKKNFTLFLETLITVKRRNPVSRKILINLFRESFNLPIYIPMFRTFLKEEIGEENLSVNIEEHIKKYVEKEGQDPNRLYDMYLNAYINKNEQTTIRELVQDLYGLKQYILHAPIGIQFITSDNPGFTIIKDKVWSLGGFGDTFEFYFPLAPTACLLLKSSDRELQENLQKLIYPVLIEKDEVERINQVTKGVADKFIFSLKKNILEHI